MGRNGMGAGTVYKNYNLISIHKYYKSGKSQFFWICETDYCWLVDTKDKKNESEMKQRIDKGSAKIDCRYYGF